MTPVPTVTLDMVARFVGVYPDVLKSDVEGAELDVLQGADEVISSRRPKILFSIHSDSLKSTCQEYLRVRGYVVVPVDGAPEQSGELVAIAA